LQAGRFKLSVHFEKRDLPVYALEVANGAPKLKEVELTPITPGAAPPGAHLPSLVMTGPAQFTATAMNMHALADFLSSFEALENHLALDETGLKGQLRFRAQ
jgi:uncharacterized protein (TIGR03435 family)